MKESKRSITLCVQTARFGDSKEQKSELIFLLSPVILCKMNEMWYFCTDMDNYHNKIRWLNIVFRTSQKTLILIILFLDFVTWKTAWYRKLLQILNLSTKAIICVIFKHHWQCSGDKVPGSDWPWISHESLFFNDLIRKVLTPTLPNSWGWCEFKWDTTSPRYGRFWFTVPTQCKITVSMLF